jgi:predicted metal-dependent hydrolase
MENTGKKAAKKVTEKTPNSLTKIAATAKTINAEVKETASDLYVEVIAEGKAVKEIATKSVKEAAEKIHVSENVAKIKEAAKKINSQIKETATEILGDVVTNRKELQANAKKMAIEAIDNANITERVASLKKTVKNANDFTFETAEGLVDGLAVNGEKWQGVANKAVKSGLKVAARQQDIMFSTFETVKGQLMNSAARFKSIIKN